MLWRRRGGLLRIRGNVAILDAGTARGRASRRVALLRRSAPSGRMLGRGNVSLERKRG
jgi:hypothetical protein